MKKILTLFLAFLVFCASVLLTVADTEYTYIRDEADLLSDTEKEAQEDLLTGIGERQNIEIYIVTVSRNPYPGASAESVSEMYFQQYAKNSDGAVFYVDMGEREWYMQGFGSVKTVYTETVLDVLEDSCIEHLSLGEYDVAFQTFAEKTEEMIVLAESGTPYSHPDSYYDKNLYYGEPDGYDRQRATGFPWFEYLSLSLVGGFVIALITVLIMKSKLKSVRRQTAARDYQKKDSLNLTVSRDLFLYHTVTKVPKPQNNSNGGHHGGGGGGRSGGGGGGGGRGGRF